MRPSFQPRLVNPPSGDPSLYIPFAYTGKAFLFDSGELGALSTRDLLKIDHIFISHTHMDHFSGFDRLLRVFLGRNKILHLFGPENFFHNLEGKLNSYQWNLVDNFIYQMAIVATEITHHHHSTRTYRCRDGFLADHRDTTVSPSGGPLLKTPSIAVTAAILDHQIPCLGFALKECFHINILKTALDKTGLIPGPWIKTFKEFLYSKQPVDTLFEIPSPYADATSNRFTLSELTAKIVRITAGQKIAYVTDVGFTDDNIIHIKKLAHGVDHLFIEAAFLDADKEIAAAKYHLTARQAGYLAAVSGAKRLTVFHFSPRYTGQYDQLRQEAETAFQHYRDNQTSPPP